MMSTAMSRSLPLVLTGVVPAEDEVTAAGEHDAHLGQGTAAVAVEGNDEVIGGRGRRQRLGHLAHHSLSTARTRGCGSASCTAPGWPLGFPFRCRCDRDSPKEVSPCHWGRWWSGSSRGRHWCRTGDLWVVLVVRVPAGAGCGSAAFLDRSHATPLTRQSRRVHRPVAPTGEIVTDRCDLSMRAGRTARGEAPSPCGCRCRVCRTRRRLAPGGTRGAHSTDDRVVRLSPGSRAGPGSGWGGAASTSSWTRSAGSAHA